jgi:IS30 family transposase
MVVVLFEVIDVDHAQRQRLASGARLGLNALIENARKLPQELYKSLTWDRGKELAAHKRFTLATDIKVRNRMADSL